ncbi:MAG: c-type cytochrome [Planctomycetota bacterium]|nr:c-type cytochrome [Planctomycetota bacterium]
MIDSDAKRYRWNNFSDASFGAPKRVLTLLGSANTAPFAWDGSAETLQAQIHKSLSHTMQSDDPPTDEQLTALAADVETLAPPPPIDQARGVQDRGHELFGKLQCSNCHAPPVFTTPDTYDVGIGDKQGNREFNPPTLLGVGQRGPYFHDNRAATLEEVFSKHKRQLDHELSADELRDLLAFLRSL